ncbi:MAG: hypothetical protein ACTSSB_15925 [Candidatus Heimdallarchaeota archaeon]
MENNFKCPECQGELLAFDNKDIITKLSAKVEDLKISLEKAGVDIDALDSTAEDDVGQIVAADNVAADKAATAPDISANESTGSK